MDSNKNILVSFFSSFMLPSFQSHYNIIDNKSKDLFFGYLSLKSYKKTLIIFSVLFGL